MKKYTQLTLEEREKLYGWRQQKISFREIGRRLKRSHTSLTKEMSRNAKYGSEYIPCKAQDRAYKRGVKQRYQAPLKKPLIFLYVREHLRMGWSPETIAGRLQIDHPTESISHECIYQYIYKRRNRRFGLWKKLVNARRKRMKKHGRSVKRDSRIPDAISIDQRPPSILNRKKAGHWESDNMIGKQSDKTAVSANVERVTRITTLVKGDVKKAVGKRVSITQRLKGYPPSFRKTLTVDNGSENAGHKQIALELGMDVYFCHAYHSWEKGTVENTIGRVRRYIPKGVSIDSISNQKIQRIEDALNNTPRKCLGFMTPNEKLLQILKRSV